MSGRKKNAIKKKCIELLLLLECQSKKIDGTISYVPGHDTDRQRGFWGDFA